MGLDTVEYLMEVENAFGVILRDEDVSRCTTVGNVLELILHEQAVHMPSQGPDREAIRDKLFVITGKQFGIGVDKINEGTRFTEDLGAD